MIKPITSWGKYLVSDCSSTGKPLSCAQFAFYVDHAAADGGDGSQAKPWNNINLAFNERIANITAAYCTVTVYIKGAVTYFVGADTYSVNDYKSRGYDNRLRFAPWDQEYVDYHYAGVPRGSFIRVNSVAFERFRFDFTVELATTLSNNLYAIKPPDSSPSLGAPAFIDCQINIVIDLAIFTSAYEYVNYYFTFNACNGWPLDLMLMSGCSIDITIRGKSDKEQFYGTNVTLFRTNYLSLDNCVIIIKDSGEYTYVYGYTNVIIDDISSGKVELTDCIVTAMMAATSRLTAPFLTFLRNCTVTVAGAGRCWFAVDSELTATTIDISSTRQSGEYITLSTGATFTMTDSTVSVSLIFAEVPGTYTWAAVATANDAMFVAENSSIAINATIPAGTPIGYGALRFCPLRANTQTYYLYNCDLSGEQCIPGNRAEPDICSRWSCFGGYT